MVVVAAVVAATVVVISNTFYIGSWGRTLRQLALKSQIQCGLPSAGHICSKVHVSSATWNLASLLPRLQTC